MDFPNELNLNLFPAISDNLLNLNNNPSQSFDLFGMNHHYYNDKMDFDEKLSESNNLALYPFSADVNKVEESGIKDKIDVDEFIEIFQKQLKVPFNNKEYDKIIEIIEKRFYGFFNEKTNGLLYIIQKLKFFELLRQDKITEAKQFYKENLLLLIKEIKKDVWEKKAKFFINLINKPKLILKQGNLQKKYLDTFNYELEKAIRNYYHEEYEPEPEAEPEDNNLINDLLFSDSNNGLNHFMSSSSIDLIDPLFKINSNNEINTSNNKTREISNSIDAISSKTTLSDYLDVLNRLYLIENQEAISKFLAKISTHDFFCVDTETTSTDVFSADLVGMSFCWKKNEAFFILLPENREEAQKIVDQFKPLFENDKIFKIGQNLKFDVLMLKQYGVEVKGELFDTMIAHYLIQPELRHGMDALAEQYLKYKTVTYEELTTENGKKNLPLRSVDKNRLADYAAEDADITFQLYEIFKDELVKNNLDKLFKTIEMPLMHVLCEMENAGVTIDEKSLKESSVKMTADMENIAKEIYSLAGHSFNISSPKQVGEVIYNELNLVDKVKKTKGGQMSTSEDVLISLKSKHPIIEKILDYRGVKKLLSTYIDALPEIVNSHTGKIHTSFNQTVTATGRLSSSNPNLQNIPVRDSMGREIRRCFVAGDDSVFLSADYSQIELRVMAHVSEDEGLISSFLSGFDFHQDTASKIFKVPTEEVTKEMRSKAKTANFGILYGISAYGLADRLSISKDEAKQMIESYFNAFPKVYDYLEKIKAFAHEHEYVETLFGRRRFIQDINSRNGSLRQNAERNAINAPIQGTAADIIKLAMINIQREIDNRNLKSRMIIQVHDELNFNVVKSEEEIMREIVKSEMENVFQMKVPLKVELSVATNWLDAH